MTSQSGTTTTGVAATSLPHRTTLTQLLDRLSAGNDSPRRLVAEAERQDLLWRCCQEALRADPDWLLDPQTAQIFGYVTGKMQSASTRAATRAGYTVARALAAPPGLEADAAAADLAALARQWQASGLLPVTGDRLSADGRAAASIPRPRRHSGDTTSRSDGAPSRSGGDRARPPDAVAIDDLLEAVPEIGGHARIMLQLTALLLTGVERRRRPAVQVGVVFGRDEQADAAQEFRLQGATGRLILQELPSGPPGLYPDPVAMAAASSPGPDFTRSVSAAWACAPTVRTAACVLWRIALDDNSPLPSLRGPSLGAAFAVAVREQLRYPASPRPSIAWLRGFFHGFRARTALTGAVAADSRLGAISDLGAKFTAAATRRWRLVVPAANRDDLHLAPDLDSVMLAATVEDADRLLRRWRTGRIAVAIGAIALVASAITVPRLLSDAARAQHEASQQSALALSTKLANLAVSNLNTHLDIAQLLAVEATRIDNTPQARAALFQAATAAPNVQRFIPIGAPVTALATAANGKVIVAGTSSGKLVTVNPATGRPMGSWTGHGSVTSVAVSTNGATIAAVVGPDAVIWKPGSGKPTATIATVGSGGAVAVSPGGQLVAALSAADPSTVTERDLATGQRQRTTVSGLSSLDFHAAFSSNATLIATDGTGAWEKLSTPSLRVIGSGPPAGLPAGGDTSGTSANGAYFGFTFAQQVQDWATTTPRTIAGDSQHRYGVGPDGEAASVVISNDGQWAATISNNTIYLSQLGAAGGGHLAATQLPASTDTSLVSFLGSNYRLVSATGQNQLALWDLGGLSQLDPPTGISVPGVQFAPGTPELAVSPDGRWLAIYSPLAQTIFVYRMGARISQIGKYPVATNVDSMFWPGDQLDLASYENDGRQITVTSASGRVIAAMPNTIGTAKVFGMAPADDDRELVLVSATGVRTVSLPSGISTQRLIAFRALNGASAYGLALSPDGDAAVAESGNGRLVYLDLASGASRVVEGPVPDGQGTVAALTRSLIVADRYSASAGSLQEWSTAGTSPVRTVPDVGTGGPIAVSPNGTMMAWVSGQGVASVVDLATGTTLATFTLPSSQSSAPEPGDLTAVRFTPDGHYLLTATPGGALGRWDLRESDLIRIACTRAARNLTRAQWHQYVGTTPPANLSCLR